ncbi:hypothetical protein CKA32_003735 [Geitlerinema sp. FC II]|nr:hypothetical protein CKA32_003735 [Geitlerinema sp. FC II]
MPLYPVFVVELRSRTDRLKVLQAKMSEYLKRGTTGLACRSDIAADGSVRAR